MSRLVTTGQYIYIENFSQEPGPDGVDQPSRAGRIYRSWPRPAHEQSSVCLEGQQDNDPKHTSKKATKSGKDTIVY